jgi:hypothetical protein
MSKNIVNVKKEVKKRLKKYLLESEKEKKESME